ncbi:MAG: DUF475 domain-containing protein [Herpetosiphon sp.]
MHITLLLTLLQVIFLEGILSVDNAAVLGSLVRRLPRDAPIPWPRSLQPLGRILDRPLGRQRSAALKVGLLGAYLGRALMLAFAETVLSIPLLRIIGAVYLLFLAVDYLGSLTDGGQEDADELRQVARSGFWGVVAAVELVDLAFSIDNVIAIVALSKNYWVVMAGVGIGIVIMRFAASLFVRLMAWEPHLEIAGYLLIGSISIQLLLDEFFGLHLVRLRLGGVHLDPELQQFALSLMIILLTIAFSRLLWLRPFNVVWRPTIVLLFGMRYFIRLLTMPFRGLFTLMVHTMRRHAN